MLVAEASKGIKIAGNVNPIKTRKRGQAKCIISSSLFMFVTDDDAVLFAISLMHKSCQSVLLQTNQMDNGHPVGWRLLYVKEFDTLGLCRTI